MNTISTRRAFNARTQRARISSGWAHDSRHFHFARTHNSNAPFEEPAARTTLGDKVVGWVSVVGLVVLLIIELI